MRLRLCFHDSCFDGAASAALFTRFFRDRQDASAEISYRGMTHHHGTIYPEGTFDGDVNAVVDYRYSPDPRLTWWFDHHASTFIRPEDETHFRADRSDRKFYDPEAKSCTRFLARIVEERFGFDSRPHAELIHWAEIIDGALFPSPEVAVRLEEPALRLMAWIESQDNPASTVRFIDALAAARTLAEIADEPWVKEPLAPILARHRQAVDVMRRCIRLEGEVATFDVMSENLSSYNKFIPYYLHPTARFVVGLSRGPERIKVSVGTNPWLPRPAISIAAVCERYGGGGHPVVGAISIPLDHPERAREVMREVVDTLRSRAT